MLRVGGLEGCWDAVNHYCVDRQVELEAWRQESDPLISLLADCFSLLSGGGIDHHIIGLVPMH